MSAKVGIISACLNYATVSHFPGDPSSITVTVATGGSLGETCGLCGTRSGDLRRADGSIADITDRTQVEAFTMDYLTPADQQALRPIRRECSEYILVVYSI